MYEPIAITSPVITLAIHAVATSKSSSVPLPPPPEPASPFCPLEPALPPLPVLPCGPVAPVAPFPPAGPCGPVGPVPDGPCGPVEPVAPVAPFCPLSPSAPPPPEPPAPFCPFCPTGLKETVILSSSENGTDVPVDAVCEHAIAYSVNPPELPVNQADADALNITNLDASPSLTKRISTSWLPEPKSSNQSSILLEASSLWNSLT